MKRITLLALLLSTFALNAYASKPSKKKTKESIKAFYEKALTVNSETNPEAVLSEILTADYISTGSTGSKTKEELIGQLAYFWKVVPNLKWEIQDISRGRNGIVVRSIASGNPKGDFFGIKTDGSKRFEIMTIDIHTVQDGKIQKSYHVEDWSIALQQLAPASETVKKEEDAMQIALDFMGAMSSGDMEKMKSLMHEDMIWHNEGDKSMPWIGPWKGKTTILETFLPRFGSNFQTLKWEPNDALSKGDTAAFFGHMIGKLSNTGLETPEFTYALRVKVKDGKVILWNWFEDSYAVSKAYHGKK